MFLALAVLSAAACSGDPSIGDDPPREEGVWSDSGARAQVASSTAHGPHDAAFPEWLPLFIETLELLEAGELDEVVAREARLRALPKPNYHYVMGRMLFAQSEYVEATVHLQIASDVPEFYSRYPDVWYYRGAAHAQISGSDQASSARRSFERFVSLRGGREEHRRDALARLNHLGTPHSAFEEPSASDPPDASAQSKDRADRSQRSAHAVIVWAEPSAGANDALPGAGVPDAAPLADYQLHERAGTVPLAGFDGSMLLLHFWASWCLPCIRELPALLAYLESPQFSELSSKGVRAVLVTTDNFLGEGEAFLDNLDLSAPKIYHDRDFMLLKALSGGAKLPTTMLVRKQDRTVLGSSRGVVEWGTPEGREWLQRAVDGGAEPGTTELSARQARPGAPR